MAESTTPRSESESRDEFLDDLMSEFTKPVGSGLSGGWCHIR